MSRCSWCCRFEWLTGLFGRNVCAGLWSGWHGCVIRWNTWRECKQINRQTILSEHQLHVVSLTEWKRWTSFEWNELHTDNQSRTHSVLPHKHTHTDYQSQYRLTSHSFISHHIDWHGTLVTHLLLDNSSTTCNHTDTNDQRPCIGQCCTTTHLYTPAHTCTHTHTQSLTLQTDVDEWSTLQPTIPTMCHVSTRLSPHLHCLRIHTHTHTHICSHTCSHTHTQTHSTTIKQ